VIEKLRRAGVKLEKEETVQGPLPLAGLQFVITGRLDSLSRIAAEQRIKAMGGSVGSDVTRSTSFLVVGADPGSKLAKAQALGTRTLTEEQFLRLLESGRSALTD